MSGLAVERGMVRFAARADIKGRANFKFYRKGLSLRKAGFSSALAGAAYLGEYVAAARSVDGDQFGFECFGVHGAYSEGKT